jgi:hypothetical protein
MVETGDTLRGPFHTDDEIKRTADQFFSVILLQKKALKNMIKILSLNFTVDTNRE